MNKRGLASPYLENCRVFLARWAKSIMQEDYAIYRDGHTNFALFNTSGNLEYYHVWGTRYAYEIPCDQNSKLRPVISSDYHKPIIDYENCMAFNSFLYRNADLFLHPSYNGYYEGNIGQFCYSHDWAPKFPSKTTPPSDMANFKIRPHKFYINGTDGHRVFKSPSVSNYKYFLRKKTMFVDNGEEDCDYLYDYWSDDKKP